MNAAVLNQDHGNNNVMTVSRSGAESYAEADIEILGSGNTFSVRQINAHSNVAKIEVYSNGNAAMINQDGMSNEVKLFNNKRFESEEVEL